jgi:alanine dehydrogenase
MLRIIEDAEVRSLIDRREALDVVKGAYCAAAAGRAGVSSPSAMVLKSPLGAASSFKIKGAVLDDSDVAGFRLVGDSNRREVLGSSYVYLMRLADASPYALVSEMWLHRLRTAVTALVGSITLAPERTAKLAVIGTGAIAQEFIRIVDLSFPGLPVVIASRSAERARDAAKAWSSFTRNPLSSTDTVQEAVRDADIVVTLSDADARLFTAADLKRRVLVCALGGQHEFDADVLDAASHFVVDEIDFVCTAGNGAHWIASGQKTKPLLERRVDATLGELLLGRKRIESDGIVLAIIQGMAICDIALAKLVFDRAGGRRAAA